MLKDLISVHARLMVLFINNIMNNLIKIAVAASVIVWIELRVHLPCVLFVIMSPLSSFRATTENPDLW